MVDCARLQHEQCQVALSGTKECSSSAKHSGEVLRKMGYSAVSGDDGAAAAAAAKSLQSCPTLCNPIDSSPPGPTVPGILQERTLEWVAISSSEMMVEEYYFLSASKVPAIPQAFKLDLLQCACNTRSIELCLNPTRLKRTELWLPSLYQKIKDNDNCPSDSQCYCICKK